jgi:hypothetical protein
VGLLLIPLALALGRAGRPDPPPLIDRDDLPIRIGLHFQGGARSPDRFLDPETGRPVIPSAPARGNIWGSAWAPWADECGRTQLVAFWKDSTLRDSALLRLSQPDGAVLDRISAAYLPTWSALCWFPDRSARILLPGHDGILYRVDFGDPDAGSRQPRPIAWRGGPARGVVLLDDLAWPRHPGLGGRILAALTVRGEPGAPQTWSIWWLRLDPEATAVIAAGPLVPDDGGGDGRCPALSPAVAGPPTLAWLERTRGRRGDGWRLRIAPVVVDPRSGDPSVGGGRARTLAEDCEPAAPAFSADGRRISYIARGPEALNVRRAVVTGPAALGTPEAHPTYRVAAR